MYKKNNKKIFAVPASVTLILFCLPGEHVGEEEAIEEEEEEEEEELAAENNKMMLGSVDKFSITSMDEVIQVNTHHG